MIEKLPKKDRIKFIAIADKLNEVIDYLNRLETKQNEEQDKNQGELF